MAITLCTVSGNVKTLLGTGVSGCTVYVTVPVPFWHSSGPSFISGAQGSTTTDSNGDFSIEVIETTTPGQRLTFTFDCSDGVVGRRKTSFSVQVPDQASADLVDLIGTTASSAIVPLTVQYGGTGASSLTAYGVLMGNATAPVSSISPSTSGYPLLSTGASSAPAFGQLNISTATTGSLGAANGGTGGDSSASTGLAHVTAGTWSYSTLVDADVNATAALAHSKMAALTVSKAAVTDASGFLTTSATSAAELGYVAGVTSAIQTQMDAKAPKASPTFTGTVTTPLTTAGPVLTSSGGVLSSEATLAKARGGTAQDNSSLTFPSSGTVQATTPNNHGMIFSGSGATATVLAPDASTTKVLVSGGASADPAWGTVALGSAVSGQLLTANGGTGQNSTATFPTAGSVQATTPNNHGVLVSGSATTATVVAPDASTAKVLVSGGASADPAWSLLTNTNLSGSAAISNANLATMAAHSFKGNNTGSTAAPLDLTATQLTAELNAFSSTLQGVVPLSGGGTTNFLRADGSWTTPAGAGDVVGPSSAHAGGLTLFDGTTGKLIKEATLTQHNVLTAGANNTVSSVAPSTAGKVLNSDGTDWQSSTITGTSFATQSANTVFAGPTSGGAATPTFRALATSDYVAPTVQTFAVTGTQTGWLFTITSGNATVGATYTNNSNTYTVLGTIASSTALFMSGTGATSGGTLTKSTGSGDASITFSTKVALATYTTPTSPRTPLYLRIRIAGGGGGGGGSATAAANNATAGGVGAVSCFGANNLFGNAGGGGGKGSNRGGAGGTSSFATGSGFAITGAAGGNPGNPGSLAANMPGGVGGGNTFAATQGADNPSANGISGGSGGSGAEGPSLGYPGAGGGGGGYCDVVIASPAATYPYVIGTGGSAGTAGTSGSNGGNGGAGFLIVEEYYQ